MKGCKNFYIDGRQIFLDGKAIPQGGDKPTKGKVIICKLAWSLDSHNQWFNGMEIGRAEVHDDDNFDFDKGCDIAYERAKRAAITKCMQIVDKQCGRLCELYNELGDVKDYCNYILTALEARREQTEDSSQIKTIATTRLFSLLSNISKTEDEELERMLAVLERENFI